jgi:hypothetical protein
VLPPTQGLERRMKGNSMPIMPIRAWKNKHFICKKIMLSSTKRWAGISDLLSWRKYLPGYKWHWERHHAIIGTCQISPPPKKGGLCVEALN